MKKTKKLGRRRIEYTYTGQFDSWVPATREFLESLMPETLSKRTASALLIAAGLGNEKIVELTGLCIRSVRALRKLMEEQEATSAIFAIKPGSGRKKKTEGIEDEVFAELDKGECKNYQQVVGILKEKFGLEATRQLAARLVKRWEKSRNLMAWKSTFHERINELWQRAKEQNHKLTRDEYASRFGVTRTTLMSWLRGSGQPDADGFLRIADVEQVSLGWLMGDERPAGDEELLPEEKELLELFHTISSEHQGDLLVLARHFQSNDRQCAEE